MNVVDSSGWLEYFTDGPNAAAFAKPIHATASLIVPSVSLFEVFKRVMTQRGEDVALEAAAMMRQGRVVPLDDALALEAARLSVERRLPMADSIILATARAHRATLWDAGCGLQGPAGRPLFHEGMIDLHCQTRRAVARPQGALIERARSQMLRSSTLSPEPDCD